jgi:hypothetical protein
MVGSLQASLVQEILEMEVTAGVLVPEVISSPVVHVSCDISNSRIYKSEVQSEESVREILNFKVISRYL